MSTVVQLEVISIECIRDFDPDMVRVTLRLGTFEYSLDIPTDLYPDIGGPLGWPTNPCNI